MGSLVYIVGVVAFVLVVSLVLVVRDRWPTSVESDVEQFSESLEGLRALSNGAGRPGSHGPDAVWTPAGTADDELPVAGAGDGNGLPVVGRSRRRLREGRPGSGRRVRAGDRAERAQRAVARATVGRPRPMAGEDPPGRP